MKVVLIDDNAAIRRLLKSFLAKHFTEAHIYSSANGVEGLGLAYAVNPDVIIIDTTIPKYSGREVIEFLVSNPKFSSLNTHVIAIHESSEPIGIQAPTNFTFLSKTNTKFLKNLLQDIVFFSKNHNVIASQLQSISPSFLNRVGINLANKSDIQFSQSTRTLFFLKPLRLLLWFYYQILLSIVMSIHSIRYSRIPESNIQQAQLDKRKLRIQTYPTIITLLAALVITLIQVGIFIGGGIAVLSTRINDTLALSDDENGFEFSFSSQEDFLYNNDQIEFTDDGVILNQIEREVIVEETVQPISFPEGINLVEEVQVVSEYITLKPEITSTKGISYSQLQAFEERSTIPEGTQITYQLSPDAQTWYYLESIEEGQWSVTEQDHVSSNSAQEINDNIQSYNESFGSGELFVKVFLHSDGSATPVLKEIVIERLTSDEYELPESLPESPDQEELVVNELDFEQLEPVIFNAAYANGDKVVLGKLLNKDTTIETFYDISAAELGNYEARVYFSSPESPTKDELIGTTSLYFNNRGEIEFLLRTPSIAGGYVTAEIVEINNIANSSNLANSIENATFTVDSTGDADDASAGDGLCATAGAECTLRAAISESNALAGADNINFSIPVVDPGYRDNDTPNTPSSGDSINGDDYWLIEPVSSLDVSSEVIIAGNTQATSIGDTAASDTNASDGTASRGNEVVISGINNVSSTLININGGDIQVRDISITQTDGTGAIIDITGNGSDITLNGVDLFANNLINSNVTIRATNASGNIIFLNSIFNNFVTDTGGGNGSPSLLDVSDFADFDLRNSTLINDIVEIDSQNSDNAILFNNYLIKTSPLDFGALGAVNLINDGTPGGSYQITGSDFVDLDFGIVSRSDGFFIAENDFDSNNNAITIDSVTPASHNSGNFIQENTFSGGTGIGINLVDTANENAQLVNPNDAGDTDDGPNELMNSPEFSSIQYLGGNDYEISGNLDARLSEQQYTIEICESTNNPSGTGACLQSLGIFSLVNPGPFTETVTLPGATGTDSFTMTATNARGSTSEFSGTESAPFGTPPVIVDADPVFDGTDWIITVDTTADTDHVSAAGVDDGSGAYSGGGTSGVDGNANGETSLREAIIVANNFAQPVTIEFNISTSDPGFRDYDDQNTPGSGDSSDDDDYWEIRIDSILPTLTSSVEINGGSQLTNQLDSNDAGPEIVVRPAVLNSSNLLHITAPGESVSVTDIALYGSASNFTGAIELQAGNVVLDSNYLGVDARGIDNSSSPINDVTILGVNSSVAEGVLELQVLNSNLQFGRFGLYTAQCDSADSIAFQGNTVGLRPDGTQGGALAEGLRFTVGHDCDALIGGDTSNERNIFGGLSSQALLLQNSSLGDETIEIYNNYFGTDATGDSNRANATADIRSQNDASAPPYVTTIIGAPGKGNLFRFSSRAIWLNNGSTRSTTIAYNTFGEHANRAILVDANQANNSNSLVIEHNYIGTGIDPYFSRNIASVGGIGIQFRFGPDDVVSAIIRNNNINNTAIGIETPIGGDYLIQGNVINNSTLRAINIFAPGVDNRLANSNDQYIKATIGGTAPLAGSLCNGTEQNCISGSGEVGIFAIDNPIVNETTIFSDNDFSGGNGPSNDLNVIQLWRGTFETFSGANRVGGQTTFRLPDTVRTGVNLQAGTELTSTTATCLDALDCPLAGDTLGSAGETNVYVDSANASLGVLSDDNLWPEIVEYIIDGSGNRIDYGLVKIDDLHLASLPFSFDGDATNDGASVSQGVARVINAENYNDRGEPWTDQPNSTRDISANDIARFQIMELEVVDANPIWHNNEWWIVVDSTSDEDNVSSIGFDDGAGAYSGGGTEGPDGLANVRTSLREALFVANQLPTNDTKNIVFCIPDGNGGSSDGLGGLLPFACGQGAADPNFDTTYPDQFHIVYDTDGPGSDADYAFNNNNINLLANQEYNWISPSSYPDPAAKPRIVIDFANNPRFGDESATNLDSIQIKGVKFTRDAGSANNLFFPGGTSNLTIGGVGDLDRNVILNGSRNIYVPGPNSNNITILGNFIGVDDDGLTRQANNSDISVTLGNGGGSGVVVGAPGNGRNIITGGGTGLTIHNFTDVTVQNNYIGFGYDGVTAAPITGRGIDLLSYDNVLIGGNISTEGNRIGNVQIGMNLDRLNAPDPSLTAQGVQVQGNIIGLDVNDNYAPVTSAGVRVRNENAGIGVEQHAKVDLGGNTFEQRNVIVSEFYHVYYSYGRLLVNYNCLGYDVTCTQSVPTTNTNLFQSAISYVTENTQIDNSSFRRVDIDGDRVYASEELRNIYYYSTSSGVEITFPSFLFPRLQGRLVSQFMPIAVLDFAFPINYDVSVLATLPDTDDGDVGLNGLQNFPLIEKATYLGGGDYLLEGSIDGNPAEAPLSIEICESFATNLVSINNYEDGLGQCEAYLGSTIASIEVSNAPADFQSVTNAQPDDYYWSTTVNVLGATESSEVYFSATAINANNAQSQYGPNYVTRENDSSFVVEEYFVPIVYPNEDGSTVTDDVTPIIDWNIPISVDGGTNLDPIERYEVFIDGQLLGVTSGNITNLAINSPLSLGQHTVQVFAFGPNNEDEGVSIVVPFIIVEPQYTFTPIYPVNVTIDEAAPEFSWTNLPVSAQAGSTIVYDLYVDGVLFGSNIAAQEFQNFENTLEEGPHTWYVVAYRIEPDNSRTQVAQTEEVSFTVEFVQDTSFSPPVSLPLSFLQSPPDNVVEERQMENNSRIANGQTFIAFLPLATAIALTAFVGSNTQVIGSLNTFGFLFGWLYRKNKKYWGYILDASTQKGIPFAIVRLYKAYEKVGGEGYVGQTVTDLDGRYVFNVDHNGIFYVEVKATGYQAFVKKYMLSKDKDVILDISLQKTDSTSSSSKLLFPWKELFKWVNLMFLGLVLGGFLYTIYATIESPVIVNFFLLVVYVLIFILNLLAYFANRHNEKIVVIDKNGNAIAGVSVREYSIEGKQLGLELTGSTGIAKLRVTQDTKYLVLYKAGYGMKQIKYKKGMKQVKMSKSK